MWILLALGCAPPEAEAIVSGPHVLYLVLDGVRVDEFSSERVSELTGVSGSEFASEAWRWFDDAMVVREGLNVGLTSTAPGHATLVTGRTEAVMTAPIEAGDPGVYYPEVPTLFEEVFVQLGGASELLRITANSRLMPTAARSMMPGFGEGAIWDMIIDERTGLLAGADESVLAHMQAVVAENPPTAWLVNLHDADRAGHDGDANDLGEYLDRVERQAAIVSKFFAWTAESFPSYHEQLLTVVTTDHGRHRHDLDDGASQHGDSCLGCREIPMIFRGGEAVAGEFIGSYAQYDIAPTLAKHLGVTMPYAEGLPLFGGIGRSGEGKVAAAGGIVATQRWIDDIDSRSEIVVGGSVISDPLAFAAEAPSMVDSDGILACFRELLVDRDAVFATWALRCMQQTEQGWEDAGQLDVEVGPFARAALASRPGETWAAWLHTPVTRGTGADVDSVIVANRTPGQAWNQAYRAEIEYTTTEMALALPESGFVFAAATSLPEPYQAYSRRIAVVAVHAGESAATQFTGDTFLDGAVRLERPTLRAVGNRVDVAFLVVGESERGIGWAKSDDAGRTWSAPELTRSDVFPNTTPSFADTGLVWAARGTDVATVCTASTPGGESVCVALDSPRVDSLAIDQGEVIVSLDLGVGEWGVERLKIPSIP